MNILTFANCYLTVKCEIDQSEYFQQMFETVAFFARFNIQSYLERTSANRSTRILMQL